MAKSFRGASLAGYSEVVEQGYSSLFRLFLTWTAFEQYLKAISCKQEDCLDWMREPESAAVLAHVRQLDSGNRLYNLVASKTRDATTRRIVEFLDSKEMNWTYLASSLRHLFAHGLLTPSANKTEPGTVGAIAELLASPLLAGVERDFSQRVALVVVPPA